MATAKFPLGRTVITKNAANTLAAISVKECLERHAQGDWGDVCKEDRQSNEEALKEGLRLFSSYMDSKGTKFWIITEHDRSVTTVLLPEDY